VSLFGLLLFGHVVGVAVLTAGVGAFVAGLHMLASARSVELLKAAQPVVRWGEQLTLVGFGLVFATGVGLGLKKSALLDAWLLASVALLAVIAVVGRVSGSRLDAIFAALKPAEAGSAVATVSAAELVAAAESTGIHLPADVTVVAIIEILFLMTLRPGWLGILISLAVAALVVGGAAWALRRRSPNLAGHTSVDAVDPS
jgi:hypothetical protein